MFHIWIALLYHSIGMTLYNINLSVQLVHATVAVYPNIILSPHLQSMCLQIYPS